VKQTLFSIMSIAAVSIAAAQGPHGPREGAPGASALNLTKVQTITGAVTAVHIGYGMEYPSITVNKTQIKVAPVWYLLDKGFEIQAGDAVSVVAAPSTQPSDAYLYAIEITNTATKLRIVLRDTNGVPLWTGRGNPDGPRAEGGCLDPSTAATVSGTVDKVTIGPGIQMPVLVVKTADGKLVTFKLGPERILLAADFELKAGEVVTVKYALETCTDELVALALTNAAGRTVTLRDDDCTPAWH
jgi:hypothetical protein